MEERKIIGIELVNLLEFNPINKSEFDEFADKIMNKVSEDIFDMNCFCATSSAKPIFEDEIEYKPHQMIDGVWV